MYDVCFSDYLHSVQQILGSSTSVRLTHISSFFMAEYYSIIYMYHDFWIHLSSSGNLGCFHVLVTVNSAAVNPGVHVSV